MSQFSRASGRAPETTLDNARRTLRCYTTTLERRWRALKIKNAGTQIIKTNPRTDPKKGKVKTGKDIGRG